MRRLLMAVPVCLIALLPTPSPTALPQPAETSAAQATKVLTIIEENHSYGEMKSQMPYLFHLATKYGYATSYQGVTHPSLPNYLALVGGSTFGVTDDSPPSINAAKVGNARSVFDQALDKGRTAKTYAQSMPRSCALSSVGKYAVKHNPWAYFLASRTRCRHLDVPLATLESDAQHNRLPNMGLVVPNLCKDAHDCSLTVADRWLRKYLPTVLASRDFTSGRLTVVVTADEDDFHSGNHVLTVVMNPAVRGEVVSASLTHYSLLGYYDHVLKVPLLRKATRGLAAAFGLA
ncbi:MAG: alkaline phosphatase family protein [Nocardioidaceae bacterium]